MFNFNQLIIFSQEGSFMLVTSAWRKDERVAVRKASTYKSESKQEGDRDTKKIPFLFNSVIFSKNTMTQI